MFIISFTKYQAFCVLVLYMKVVIFLTNLTEKERERERLGDWEIGRLGDWETGRLGDWEIGRLGDWETGRLGDWEIGRLGDRLLYQGNLQSNIQVCPLQ